MRNFKLLTIFLLIALVNAQGQPELIPTTPPSYSATRTADEVVLQFVVEAGKIECFYQPIMDPKYVTLEVDYQVTEGGELDVNFLIKNPRNVQIAYDAKRRDGTHRVDISDPGNGFGDYAFCFDNSFSMQTKKNVFFELFLLDKDGNFFNNYDSNAGKSDLLDSVEGFERITTKVKGNLNKMEALQTQLRALESRDRSIMEDNFSRVNFWSSIHMLTILTVIAIQVFTIRSLFIENSTVGRLIRKGRLND